MRRRALAASLDEHGVDAVLVTDLLHTRYLTGFGGTNGQLLVTSTEAIFLTDGRYAEQARHEVPDLERIAYASSYRSVLPDLLAARGVSRLGFESEEMSVAAHDRLGLALGGSVQPVPLTDAVEVLRARKDEDELDAIRRAQAATDAAFEAVVELLAVGVSETAVAEGLERSLKEAGADGVAFEPIVAFGENAAEPHHRPGNRQVEEGDVIVLDFGALVDGYHSDMTRTIAFGEPPAILNKVHDVVRQAQQAGIDAVRAGTSCAQVDAASRGVIADAGYGEAFVHGLGHGVGLQIHESPWLSATHDEPLPEGAVVTIEPGVYLAGIGGVRIEDMVEVAHDGGRVVGTSTRDLIEL